MQNQECKQQVASQQQEMELQIPWRVEGALQMRHQQQPMPAATLLPDPDLHEFMTTQNRHIQMFTEMVMQIMQQQPQSMLHHKVERSEQVHGKPIQVTEIIGDSMNQQMVVLEAGKGNLLGQLPLNKHYKKLIFHTRHFN